MGKNNPVSVCFFEDEYSRYFKPLTLTRPMDDLRVGIYTIREKWMQELGFDSFQRTNRQELAMLYAIPGNGSPAVIWINSRLLPDPAVLKQIHSLKVNQTIEMDGTPLAIKTDAATSDKWLNHGVETNGFHALKPAGKPLLLRQLWDLLRFNATEVERDIERTPEKSLLEPGAGLHLYGTYPVWVSEGVTIEPGVSFVTTGGPVYIGPQATVMAGTFIRGPVAVCRQATVRMGAKIYENSTIGPVCKVSGELNNVIFHSYSNKSHDGFAGNSIFGQWCNLGADTNTSNLKNNYGTIRFTDWHSREEQDTGEQFLGTVMGDHSKTGINSMLNTGTNCGVCCNLYSHGYPPKLIPSFSWVNSGEVSVYRFDKAIETMERTMKRRNVALTEDYIKLMKHIFNARVAGVSIGSSGG